MAFLNDYIECFSSSGNVWQLNFNPVLVVLIAIVTGIVLIAFFIVLLVRWKTMKPRSSSSSRANASNAANNRYQRGIYFLFYFALSNLLFAVITCPFWLQCELFVCLAIILLKLLTFFYIFGYNPGLLLFLNVFTLMMILLARKQR